MPRYDFNGDGRSDILWRNADGTISDWLGTGTGGFTINDGNALRSVATDWIVVGVGDFNGDGRADLLWRHFTQTSELSNWLGTASGGWVINDANAMRTLSLVAQVKGVGDFNGDGRDDVLIVNSIPSGVSILYGSASGALTGTGASIAAVPTGATVAGIGDFNLDGRDDILWRSTTGALSDWLSNGDGTFTPVALATVPTDWRVAGIGDFNGDGRDDILWRNDNGALSDWLASPGGGFTINDANAFVQVPTSWHVMKIGDYNGDGRDDILWRNDDGALSDWLGTASGGFIINDPQAYANVPVDWSTAGTSGYSNFGFWWIP